MLLLWVFSPGLFAQGQFKIYFYSTSLLWKSWSINANSISVSTVGLCYSRHPSQFVSWWLHAFLTQICYYYLQAVDPDIPQHSIIQIMHISIKLWILLCSFEMQNTSKWGFFIIKFHVNQKKCWLAIYYLVTFSGLRTKNWKLYYIKQLQFSHSPKLLSIFWW